MRHSAILDELVNLATERGLTVRRESMTRGVSSGGLCVLKGVPTVFVDDRASTDAQIEVLASVLRRYDWGEREMAPPVRALLQQPGAAAPAGRREERAPSAGADATAGEGADRPRQDRAD